MGCAACGLPRFIIHLGLGKQMVPSGYKILFYSALQDRRRLQLKGWEFGRWSPVLDEGLGVQMGRNGWGMLQWGTMPA